MARNNNIIIQRCHYNITFERKNTIFSNLPSVRDASRPRVRLFRSRRRPERSIIQRVRILYCDIGDDQPPRRSVIISRPTSATRPCFIFQPLHAYGIGIYIPRIPLFTATLAHPRTGTDSRRGHNNNNIITTMIMINNNKIFWSANNRGGWRAADSSSPP